MGTAIVGAFYLYSYLWQVVVITIVFVELYLLMARQWSRFFNLLKISSLALALAAPVILSTFKASLLTGYWENMQRVGFVATHLPPIEAYYYGRWLIVAGLIWTIFFVKQLKDKTVTAWYFLIVSAAIFLALVSNVITGKIFDRYSREQIRNYLVRFDVWFGNLLFCNKIMAGKIYITALTSFLILIGSMTIFAEIRRSIVPPFSLPYSEMVAVQDYRAPLWRLDAHESEPKVIWASDSISRYVPYLSKHYVLYPGLLNAHLYLVPNSEVRERYLTVAIFRTLVSKS